MSQLPVINVRKSGNVFVCFWDVSANRPVSCSTNFEEAAPIGGFPLTFNSEQELRMKVQGYSFNFVEEVRPEQPVAKRPADADAQVARIMKDAGEHVPLVVKPAPQPAGGGLDKAVQMYKILLAQFAVADDETKEILQIKLQTCLSLVQTVWPGSGEILMAAQKEMEMFNVN